MKTMELTKPNEEDMDTSVLVLVGNVMENTAAHGIPNIKRAHTHLRRIVWAMLFLFGLSMFALQAQHLIYNYFQYDVNINFEISYDPRLEFPAVTVCNMNPIKSSYMMENEELYKLFNGQSWDDAYGTDYPFSVSRTTGTTPGSTTPADKKRYKDWDNIDFGAEDDYYYQVLMARDIIAAMPYEDRRASGHELDDMLLDCSFSGYPCSPNNFTYFYNYRYGNCFTFRGDLSNSKDLYTTKAGPLYGLSMEFYVEQSEYIPDIQPAAGIRVTIHPKNIMPFPEDDGVSISPGQETSIGLKKRLVTHIADPYTNCTRPEDIQPNNVFLRQFPWVVYNRAACEKNCLYYELLDQCNCSDPRFRYNSTDGEVCQSSSCDQNECVDRVEDSYVTGKLTRKCTCTQSCWDVSYEPTVSASLWPNQKFTNDVIETIGNTEDLTEEYAADPTFIESNFA